MTRSCSIERRLQLLHNITPAFRSISKSPQAYYVLSWHKLDFYPIYGDSAFEHGRSSTSDHLYCITNVHFGALILGKSWRLFIWVTDFCRVLLHFWCRQGEWAKGPLCSEEKMNPIPRLIRQGNNIMCRESIGENQGCTFCFLHSLIKFIQILT